MIKIVDYGMGNLRSVQKAFEKLDIKAEICTEASQLADADKLVLPGVGAFRDAIGQLEAKHLDRPILEHLAAEKPFLGICLGLQLLLDVSEEDGRHNGLGVIPGKVVRFPEQPELKIPHMGWNQLEIVERPKILEGIPEDTWFYFVHSYYVVPEDESVIAARTEHGIRFVSMIARGNLFATQFHPEKSQQAGLKLLDNFANL